MTLSDVHPVGGLEIGFLLTRGYRGCMQDQLFSQSCLQVPMTGANARQKVDQEK